MDEKKQVRYNIPIQIESDCISENQEPGDELLLGVLIMDAQIDIQRDPTLDVSITTIKASTRRNVFKCMSIHGESYEHPVLYGEDFYICLTDVEGPTLYLNGLVPRINNFRDTRGRIPIALTAIPDKYCKFRIIDPDPTKMISLNGTPVKTFVRISVVHSYSNSLLAIDVTDVVTSSESIDYGSHFYTYRDSRHRITPVNFWKFITPTIREDTRNDDGGGAAN